MPRIKPLSPAEAQRTLGHRFAARVDKLRQLHTNFGLRPKRVFLVWTRYTGSERGEGDELEVKRIELLPTPRVDESTTHVPTKGGTSIAGTIQLSEVSTRYSQAELNGFLLPFEKEKIPEPFDFFYEVVADGRYETEPQRFKYSLASPPRLVPEEFGWRIALTAASESRDRQGRSQLGEDRD